MNLFVTYFITATECLPLNIHVRRLSFYISDEWFHVDDNKRDLYLFKKLDNLNFNKKNVLMLKPSGTQNPQS